MKEAFRKISNRISYATGTAAAFVIALGVIVVWGLTGPMFGYSDTWQLVINTGTTIVTFLMVFLIQNTQNRDGKALQLKLDELIRSTKTARNSFMDLENLSDDELSALDREFKELHDQHKVSPALHALHSKVEAEKQRRHTLKNAGEAVANFLNKSVPVPSALPSFGDKSKKNK